MSLKCNFDRKSKLKVKLENGQWIEVQFDLFRSWTGDRRIDGKAFHNRVYWFGTNGKRPVENNHLRK